MCVGKIANAILPTLPNYELLRRRVMRQRLEIVVGRARDCRAHGGVGAGAGRVAIRLEGGDEVVDALPGEPRNLVLSGEARLMAGRAAPLRRDLGALLGERRVDRLVARLGGKRGVML